MASWDAIVIGSGLGGLTAGALLAKDGRRVLVLERHTRFGGAATTFPRKGLNAEVGLHQMDGLDSGDYKAHLFRHLGVDRELTFLRLPEFYAVRHPLLGEDFVMPFGLEAGREEATKRFPHQAAPIRRYFATLQTIRKQYEILNAKFNGFWWKARNYPVFPLRFFPVLKHRGTNVGAFLDGLFGGDEAVKLALFPNYGYFTDDPYELSLLYFGYAQGSYYIGGGHYIQGGSQQLSDSLVRVITGAGGVAQAGRTATGIILDRGRTAGVRHVESRGGGGEAEERAPVIFGNASPPVLADILPAAERTRFLGSRGTTPHSTSLWVVFLGFNTAPAGFGVRAHSTFVLQPWLRSLRDTKASAALLASDPGERVPYYVFVDYGRVDARLTDGRTHFGTLTGLDRLSNWEHLDEATYRARKRAWMDFLIAALDREFPGIAAAVVYKEMATARTMRRYLNTPGGAVYGYAPTPGSLGLIVPNSRTPVPGLFLASTFAHPGGGFSGAIFAGHHAYQAARRFR